MSDNTPIEVDANTDNLDDFSLLMSGSAVPKEAVEEAVIPDDIAEDEADPVETDVDEDAEESEETAEDEGDAEEDEPQEELVLPKKNRKSAKERINELTTERYAEKARADLLEKKLLELESRINQKDTPEPKPVAPSNEGRPDPDARDEKGELKYALGEFDPDFIADLTRFTIATEQSKYDEQRERKAEEARAIEAEQRLTNEWNEKLAKTEEDYADLRPVIAGLEAELGSLEPAYGTYLAQTIMGMDLGPEVLYYLANNVNEARQIIASGPANATLSLGRLEARIQSTINKTATPTPRLTTQAPPPAATTRGSGTRVSVKPDTDDLDAFERVFYK